MKFDQNITDILNSPGVPSDDVILAVLDFPSTFGTGYQTPEDLMQAMAQGEIDFTDEEIFDAVTTWAGAWKVHRHRLEKDDDYRVAVSRILFTSADEEQHEEISFEDLF